MTDVKHQLLGGPGLHSWEQVWCLATRISSSTWRMRQFLLWRHLTSNTWRETPNGSGPFSACSSAFWQGYCIFFWNLFHLVWWRRIINHQHPPGSQSQFGVPSSGAAKCWGKMPWPQMCCFQATCQGAGSDPTKKVVDHCLKSREEIDLQFFVPKMGDPQIKPC